MFKGGIVLNRDGKLLVESKLEQNQSNPWFNFKPVEFNLCQVIYLDKKIDPLNRMILL